jgi:hypothetical protein
MYKDDLPQPRLLSMELEMWSEQCQMEKDLLPFVNKVSFLNIYTLLQIFATVLLPNAPAKDLSLFYADLRQTLTAPCQNLG